MRLSRILHRWSDRPEHDEGQKRLNRHHVLPRREIDNITPSTWSPAAHSLNYSALKKVSRKREVPVLNEDDLEETFIKGGGPGGQCINKRSTNVDLLHKPSGIRVKCQETRSLQDNRRIARKLIIKKLDALNNPGLSKEEMRDARVRERKRRKAKRARKKTQESGQDSDGS